MDLVEVIFLFAVLIGIVTFVMEWNRRPRITYLMNVDIHQRGLLGYKILDEGWKRGDVQYKLGQTVCMQQSPILGERGFHFCLNAFDCLRYYACNEFNKFALVEALGEVYFDGTKAVSDKLATVKEFTRDQFIALCKQTQVEYFRPNNPSNDRRTTIITLANNAHYWHTDGKLIRWKSAFTHTALAQQ